ncbi:hypothetical protein HAX54_032239 [Datura stramonium]|uniref:Uncharacterized protein n=1 Tax=Datura stramonium TaxID=4076 RepID=A0ABS8RLD3_DATST|nr:hypothetical protein [Datura stramonium]
MVLLAKVNIILMPNVISSRNLSSILQMTRTCSKTTYKCTMRLATASILAQAKYQKVQTVVNVHRHPTIQFLQLADLMVLNTHTESRSTICSKINIEIPQDSLPASPSYLNSIVDEVIVKENEETDDEVLIPRGFRPRLAEDSTLRGSKITT